MIRYFFCRHVIGTKGNDDNPGTEEKPFKTISKSRDVIRSLKNTTGLPDGGVVVTVIPGDYEFLDSPLEFTSEDSGTEKSPILYGFNTFYPNINNYEP